MTPTVVSTGTGSISIAYDYSAYYERLATAAESAAISLNSSTGYLRNISVDLDAIAANLQIITTISTSTGIHTNSPYDWATGINLFQWYVQQGNTLSSSSVTTTVFTKLLQAIDGITTNMPKFK
jgi:hypothetical protein